MNNNIILSEEQRDEVELRLRSLLEICQIYKTPMFASVVIGNTEEGTEYNNIVYGASSHKIDLTENKIEKHILVANGFNVVPPRDSVDMMMESVAVELSEGEKESGEV